jgi:hypothetical protein
MVQFTTYKAKLTWFALKSATGTPDDIDQVDYSAARLYITTELIPLG